MPCSSAAGAGRWAAHISSRLFSWNKLSLNCEKFASEIVPRKQGALFQGASCVSPSTYRVKSGLNPRSLHPGRFLGPGVLGPRYLVGGPRTWELAPGSAAGGHLVGHQVARPTAHGPRPTDRGPGTRPRTWSTRPATSCTATSSAVCTWPCKHQAARHQDMQTPGDQLARPGPAGQAPGARLITRCTRSGYLIDTLE